MQAFRECFYNFTITFGESPVQWVMEETYVQDVMSSNPSTGYQMDNCSNQWGKLLWLVLKGRKLIGIEITDGTFLNFTIGAVSLLKSLVLQTHFFHPRPATQLYVLIKKSTISNVGFIKLQNRFRISEILNQRQNRFVMLLENVDIVVDKTSQKYVVSLDVGTTTIRAFVYDQNGQIRGRDLDKVSRWCFPDSRV